MTHSKEALEKIFEAALKETEAPARPANVEIRPRQSAPVESDDQAAIAVFNAPPAPADQTRQHHG